MNDENGKNIQLLTQSKPIANDSLCRLCANANGRIIGIYSEEGLSNDLSNKMNLYLPIKVSENDTLPLQCCWNCASTILAWHELVVVSVEADRKLRSILHSIETKPHDVDIYESFEELTTSQLQDERFEVESPVAGLNVFYQEPTNTIEQCKSVETKEKHTSNNKKQYLVHCNVIADESLFKYLENIQNPILETDDPKDTLQGTVVNKTEGNSTSDCSAIESNKAECFLKYTNKENNKEVAESELEEKYNFSCQYCTSMFVNEDEILAHVKTEHSNKHLDENNDEKGTGTNKKKVRCRKLDQTIINTAKIVIDGRVYYSCKVCGKILHSPYTYIWHIRIHTGERPYVCDLCGKQFRISQGLVRHVKETHQGVKNFGCDICGRMFSTRRNVQEHRRIHTNERPYVCDLCGKSFKQKASLFVHNRSHSDSYPYTCSYCNQGFRTRPPLAIHMTRHTGEKPYPCDICGRFFRIKYELKRHKLIHSEEKPFSCGECGLHFRQKRYLKNHNKTNHK